MRAGRTGSNNGGAATSSPSTATSTAAAMMAQQPLRRSEADTSVASPTVAVRAASDGVVASALKSAAAASAASSSKLTFGRDKTPTSEVAERPFAVPASPTMRRSLEHAAMPFPSLATDENRHQVDEKSLEAWRYLMKIPGKNVRDQLIDAFQPWFGVSDEALLLIKQIVGFLHSASLIVDDIEDHSEKRRGVDAAHVAFGVDKALNGANYVYFLALEKVLMLQSTQAVEAFTSEMLNLHRGQGRDIWWRVDTHIPTVDDYDGMVMDKTGGLFRLAVRLMACLSPLNPATRPSGGRKTPAMSLGSFGTPRLPSLTQDSESDSSPPPPRAAALAEDGPLSSTSSTSTTPSPSPLNAAGGTTTTTTAGADLAKQMPKHLELCNALSVFFQIRDDVINIASPDFHVKKGFCEDITEGKLSFPVILTVRKFRDAPDAATRALAEELLAILKEQTTNDDRKRRAVEIMCLAGAVDATMDRLAKLRATIDALIEELGGNGPLRKIVAFLATDLDDCHHTMERVVRASSKPC